MWKELEDKLGTIEGKDLQKELLTDVDFILDNFGQPKQYYDGVNETINEINTAIDRLLLAQSVIFTEDKEETVRKLYQACSGKEANGKEYKLFYSNLWGALDIWYYGDKIGLSPNHSGPYTCLKFKLFGAKRLLETGEVPFTRKKLEEYLKEAGKQPENQYQ